MSDYLQRVSNKLDDLTDEEFTKIIDDIEKSNGWTPDVVYKVYCNDDLKTLPFSILEDMKFYIDQVILEKIRTGK